MVFRMELTNKAIEKTLDMKNIPTSSSGYTLPPGVCEVININLMLKSLLPKDMKVNNTIDDVRLNSTRAKKNNQIYQKVFFLYSFTLYPITLGNIMWYSRFFSTDSRKL